MSKELKGIAPEKSKLEIRKYRKFSEDLKRRIVADLDAGRTTMKNVVSLYNVSSTSVYNWIYAYSIHHQQGTRMVVEHQSEAARSEALAKQVAELERIVGQKQVQIDVLEQLIKLANEHYQTDLKKTLNTQP